MRSAVGCLLAVALVVAAVGLAQGGGTYTAAAVQWYTVPKSNANDQMLQNVGMWDKLMFETQSNRAAAGNTTVDIFVFPEVSLGHSESTRAENAKYGENVPDPDPSFVPCNASLEWRLAHPVLTAVSCAAAGVDAMISFGFIEVEPCSRANNSACPSDDMFIYNCVVVFDPNGALVAKYRKYHLFLSPLCQDCFNRPPVPEHVNFTSDFGVTFGLFECFEIQFYDPAAVLVQDGITDFVYGASWTNLPPLATANQMQQAWSRSFNVTLIAANNGKDRGKSGSGIYVNGDYGADGTFFSPTLKKGDDNKVIVRELPIRSGDRSSPLATSSAPSQPRRGAKPGRRSPRRLEDAVELAVAKGSAAGIGGGDCGITDPFGKCTIFTPASSGSVSVTAGNLTCTLNYTTVASVAAEAPMVSGSKYALYAINGDVWFAETVDLQTCALVHCSDSIAGCIVADPSDYDVLFGAVTFESVSLSGTFDDAMDHVFPFAMQNGGQLLPPEFFTQTSTSEISSAPVLASSGGAKLINVALYGRVWFA